jgi:hypothetical protein
MFGISMQTGEQRRVAEMLDARHGKQRRKLRELGGEMLDM